MILIACIQCYQNTHAMKRGGSFVDQKVAQQLCLRLYVEWIVGNVDSDYGEIYSNEIETQYSGYNWDDQRR